MGLWEAMGNFRSSRACGALTPDRSYRGRASAEPGAHSTATVPDLAQAPDRIPATGVDLALHSWWERTSGIIGLECAFGGHLDEAVLARAALLLLDVEPILGFRFVADSPAPHWLRVPASERTVLTVVTKRAEYEGMRRTGLDAAGGAQIALCLWPREAGDRLLFKMTHLVGDGVSLQLLASRLGSLYSALALDPGYRPSPGRVRTRDPRQLLDSVPKLARLRAILDFAWFMAPRLLPRPTHRLPLPDESVGPAVPVIRRLPAPSLSSLSRYGKERGATVNDVFLAAAYRALAACGWDGTSALRIPIAVDLRRWCLPPEQAATIANVSSWEYPYLMRDLGRSFDETIARVAALTRRRKKGRPGLAIGLIALRLVKNLPERADRPSAGSKTVSRRSDGSRVLLTFSNEGLLAKPRLRFGEEVPISAHILPPFVCLPALHVCLSGYDGALTLAAVTSENGEAHVGRFLDALLDELPAGSVRR